MPDESSIQSVETGATPEEVQQIVTTSENNILDSMDSSFDGLSANLVSLADSVTLLANANQEQEQQENIVYTVRIDPEQVQTAKVAVRLACTEGLICIALLAALVGINAFRVLTGSWS